MGRILLIGRLAMRDLKRRPAEAVLLLIAILAATTTLTLGLVVRNAASDPYQRTRAATNGPDVVVTQLGRFSDPAALTKLVTARGVTDHSGPYPVVAAKLVGPGGPADVEVEGRDTAAAAVDQPQVTHGGWVRAGGVVLEAAFAESIKATVGATVTLGGRPFTVAGLAVTAASAPYPGTSCVVANGCIRGTVPKGRELPAGLLQNPGLVWLTQADARSFTSPQNPPSYVLNLKLADPRGAKAFVRANNVDNGGLMLGMQPWPEILDGATELAGDSRILLLIGAWLLGLLAVASLSVLVGGRMADQTRRVGLLKAVGGTPGLVAAVLLAEYLLVAVVAAAGGLVLGALTAPLLTGSNAGLVGSAGTPSLTWSTAALVTAVALAVAGVATAVPAVRGARSSTVRALADSARPPRRTGWLIALSGRLPVPLLLALRVAARRPRRAGLAMAGVAVTVSGVYVLLILNAFLGGQSSVRAYSPAQVAVLRHVLLVWTVMLLCLAAVNAIVITWATVLDNRHSSALARALGATPREVTVALAAAQVLPTLIGAVLGVFPGGFVLFAAIMGITGGDRDRATLPSVWQLLVLVLTTVLVVAALTAVPARLGGRRSVVAAL